MKGKHTGSKPLHTHEEELAICNCYWTRQSNGYYPSYQEVSTQFHCSAAHVRNMLKKHGYNRRTHVETREDRPCKPTNPPNGPAPLCACDCGLPVKWLSNAKVWQKYAPGHYQPKKPYHNSEWLVREYCEKGRSVEEIANQFGVNKTAIREAMKVRGIERRTTKDSLILRGSVSGSNNPAWKGGVAKWAYSSDWKRLCKQIKDRDKWMCQLCGDQRKRWGHLLHVHHIDENKTNNHPHNLIALCSTCHKPIHGNVEIRAKLTEIAIANTERETKLVTHSSPAFNSRLTPV